MRRKIIYFIVIAFCFPLSTRADEASKMAKIQKLFKVTKMDQLSAQSMQLAANRVRSGIVQQMFGVKLNADQQEKVNDLSEKVMKIVSNALNWDALEPEYAELYAAAYTEQQIDDLLAFYKSPTGQVMIEKTPVLMQEAKWSRTETNGGCNASDSKIDKGIHDASGQEHSTGKAKY